VFLKSARWILFIFIAFVLVFATFRFSFRSKQFIQKKAELPHFRSAVLITIDTLRGDYLGYAGNPSVRSPSLDSLSRYSTVFSEAYTNLPLTLPAHCAMFTSRFPCATNVQLNVSRLSAEVVTIADILKNKGIKTAGFPKAVLTFPRGQEKGFEYFEGKILKKTPKQEGYRNHSRIKMQQGRVKFDGVNRIKRAIKWIDERDQLGERYFLWVHMFQPHLSYNPGQPVRYIDIDKNDEFVDNFIRRMSEFWVRPDNIYSEEEIRISRKLYKNEILWNDHFIKPLLNHLNGNLKEKPFLMITADHGETLHGKNPYFGHGNFLSREELHIPCLVNAQSIQADTITKTGEISMQLMQSIDVAPTILAALGLEIPDYFQGMNIMNLKHIDRMIPFSARSLDLSVGAMDSKYKVVWRELNDTWNIWDHTIDPDERNPIQFSSPLSGRLKELQAFAIEYRDLQSRTMNTNGENEEISGSFKNMLKNLGYLQ